MAYDANDPADVELVKGLVENEVKGLKSKNTELIGEAKKAKEKLEALESKIEGLDLDNVRKILKNIDDNEETKLIAEGKVDEVVNRRTERLRADFEKKIGDLTDKLSSAERLAAESRSRMVSSAVRDAAIKAGMRPEALDDAVYRAQAAGFKMSDDGEAVILKGGEVVLGKDGKTPLGPLEFVEELREKAPHLWPQAAGGGASGGGGSATKKFKDMSEAERAALYRKSPEEYARVKAAG